MATRTTGVVYMPVSVLRDDGIKVYLLNCGLMHPPLAPLLVPHLDRVPCLCLLLAIGERLVLVDTGFGSGDVADPRHLGLLGYWLLGPRMVTGLTAREQVRRLGYDPGEVSDIVCTHLDRDHSGGLPDFPRARVHVLVEEMSAALSPANIRERERYRPRHFAHGPRWVTYDEGEGEYWQGLKRIPLRGLPEGLFLVPCGDIPVATAAWQFTQAKVGSCTAATLIT